MTEDGRGHGSTAGIPVGSAAPGIDTLDANGERFRLDATLATRGGVLLCFIRGTW